MTYPTPPSRRRHRHRQDRHGRRGHATWSVRPIPARPRTGRRHILRRRAVWVTLLILALALLIAAAVAYALTRVSP